MLRRFSFALFVPGPRRMKIRFPIWLIAAAMFAAQPSPGRAADARGDRAALVIGNAKYPDAEAPLKEPINDARDVADELKRDGFDVEIGENLTADAMRRAFDRLYARIKPGSVALVFYSGYGIQSGRQSYMIPVDAQIWVEPDVRRDGIGLESVLGEINSRGASVKIALIDASRRNPFERRFRSFSAGLAPVVAPTGSLVMYSAAVSSVTADSGAVRSLFVSELLKEIRVPDLTAEETLNRTRVGVIRASRSEQVPWISSSLAEDFSFIPGQKPLAAPVAVAKPLPADPPRRDPEAQPRREAALPQRDEPQPQPQPATLAPKPEIPRVDLPKNDTPAITAPRPDLADDPTIKSLTARIVDNPDDGNALYRRGQVYASKGAYALAIKDFNETLRLNPKDVEAFNNRCWVRAVVEELQAALKDCNEALRLRPNFVDALDSRGLVNLKSGLVKNAIADFDAALKINPRLTSSLYGRGLAKQRSGAPSDGEIDIADAKSMDPNIANEFVGYGVR